MQEFISTTQLDKNSKIAASKKATADRRDSMRAVTRVLKIQTNKLSKQDEAHLEGLFIEAKQVHNHLLTLGNLHRESEREQIVANPGHKIQHFDFTHFKGHYIKVRNKRWKNEVRPLRYISAQMKQSIGQKIQSSIFGLATSKKKGHSIGMLGYMKECNCIRLNQLGATYDIYPNESKIYIQRIKKHLRVHGMDQITSIKEPFEFASADLVKKANGFYLHCLLYVQKDISKEPEQICLPSVGIDTGIKDQLSFSKAGIKVTFDRIDAKDSKRYKRIQKSINRARYVKTQPGAKSKYRKRTKHELQVARVLGANYRKRCNILKRMKLRDDRRKSDRENKLVHAMKESFRTVYLEDIHYPGWQRLWGNKSSSNRVAQVVSKLEGVGIAKFIDRFKKSSLVCRISGLSPPEFKDLTKFQKLGIRRWDCPCCRESKDRDIEAAKVIESEGRILHKETEEGLEVGIFIESFILRLQSIVGVHIQFG